MFEPGMLVLCVDDKPRPESESPTGSWSMPQQRPRAGAVYTIRAVGVLPEVLGGGPAVWLAEIIAEIDPWWEGEHGWRAHRFRPLRPEALDVFRQALAPAPKQAESA